MRNALAVLAALSYPLLVYLAVDRIQPRYLALFLLAVFLLRWRRGNDAGIGSTSTIMAIAAVGYFMAAVFVNEKALLLAYPIMVSLVFLSIFAHSLYRPPTIVEKLARLGEPDLPPQGVSYTRKVTWVWCGFFLINGLISVGTVWHGDMAVWGLYNGLVSYVLMGTLFGIEWLVRNRVRKAFQYVG
ncbi:hypothetical protein [Methylomagnum sp.]